MTAIPGSEFAPGLRQRITLRLGPAEPGRDEKILLIGFRANTAPADFDLVPQRMISQADGVELFKEGSQLALMTRAAFAVGPLARLDQQLGSRGFVPQVWTMAVEPPVEGGDVAAQWTFTVAGAATASVAMPVEVANERSFVQVVSGDSAATVAGKIDTAVQAMERNLPATTGVAAEVVTLVAREKGAHLNGMFLWADDRRVPGITVTAARSVDGVGVKSLTAALAAALAGDWAVVVVNQEDDATRALLRPHVQEAWDENVQRRRRVIMPHGGLLTDAATDAQAIDDWRVIVANLERRVGTGIPWAPGHSSRSFSWEGAAALATRLESQLRPNWNFNDATLPVRGRSQETLTGAEYDAAHQAGVSIITDDPTGRAEGRITDPITTATTDQTGVTSVTDRTFLPAEIPRVVRRIAALHAIKDAGFSQATAVNDEATRLDIKSAGLSVLDSASEQGWIQPVSDADVNVGFETVGGSQLAVREQSYNVIVGLDIVRVDHLVGRA